MGWTRCVPFVACYESNRQRTHRRKAVNIVWTLKTDLLAWVTAMQASQSLHLVALYRIKERTDGGVSAAGDVYAMLAYALFSAHAKQHMKRVRLPLADLRDVHVETMRQVIQYPDPIALLFSIPPSLRDAHHKRIVARVFYLYEQSGDNTTWEPDVTLWEASSPTIVRVVAGPTKKNPSWWRVLLPGWGVAWVRRNDAKRLSHKQLTPDSQTTPTFTSLRLSLSDRSASPVLRLLGFIGHGTRDLEVTATDDEAPTRMGAWCRQVFLVFKLRVPCREGLWFLVRAATFGESKREHLVVNRVIMRDASDVSKFFVTLRDPEHPLTKCLKLLDLDREVQPSDVSSVLFSILELVQSNRSLQSINIWLSHSSPTEPADAQAMKDALTEYLRDHKVVVRSAPLESDRTVAFLSVVVNPCSTSVVRQLDAVIMKRIFDFAAYGVTRRVAISCRGASERRPWEASNQNC